MKALSTERKIALRELDSWSANERWATAFSWTFCSPGAVPYAYTWFRIMPYVNQGGLATNFKEARTVCSKVIRSYPTRSCSSFRNAAVKSSLQRIYHREFFWIVPDSIFGVTEQIGLAQRNLMLPSDDEYSLIFDLTNPPLKKRLSPYISVGAC